MEDANVKKVLVAEDELDIRSALEAALTDAGFSVTTAADGELALAACIEDTFDVILLDIHMPKMNGIELLARIRDREDGRQIPVTVLTATDTMGAISDVTSIGGPNTDFVSKTDFSLEQIVAHVQKRAG